ncbi:tetratricopeptide repeat protein [Fodinibius sp.]|uniref:tetratricopeptide repeat protein n=1 Tax=Fodinibius sp. TaxID=1872440 RepID=UPI002ACDB9AC|nr:tetratricopeptide repeat protein [Fodinibius sp.]MDZ7660698.1 tetratricopeptide repeat protein [Fodinibius sp.]
MIHYYTRIASLVLAFGFFISCSTLQPSNQESANAANLSEQQIQQQIKSLDKDISSNPEQADLYFQKGKLLTQLAQKKEDPSERISPYTIARQVLDRAENLYDNTADSENKVSDLLNVTWSLEHNQGIKLLQDKNAGQPNYERAIAHFNNATVVIPDSAVSYTMKARTLYKNQQQKEAIKTLETARKKIENAPTLLLEQLAFLYLENNNPKKAIRIYEQAESFSSRNLNLLHGLSNAYINAGEHQKAVELLEQLIKDEPQNIVYAQSLATELYFLGKSKVDSVTAALKQGDSLDETAFDSVDTLFSQAKEQFNKISDANPGNLEIQERTATFYFNSASQYQKLLPLVSEEHQKKLQEKIKQYLSASIPLFENLAEQGQKNKEIWKKLFQAYSILEMEQEAENAKANL